MSDGSERAGRRAAPQPARSPRGGRPTHPSGGGSHELRIIGGQWKRTKLPVADAPGLRPTPDRVRETLFNWLGQDLTGWRCLDAYAGSGALGFEAASRGAEEVVLVEREARLTHALRGVQQRLKAEAAVRIETADALAWMARCAPDRFELVFVDPPFDANVFEPALHAARRVVVPDGFIYLEADRPFDDEVLGPGLRLHRHGKAGAVHYHLIQRGLPG
jgi:16S rRNA (guanine966-N2)-methyltransferase